MINNLAGFALAFFLTISISLNPFTSSDSGLYLNPQTFMWVVLFGFIYILITAYLRQIPLIPKQVGYRKRIICFCTLTAIVLSTMDTIGFSIDNYENLSTLFSNVPADTIKTIIKWAGTFFVLFVLLCLLFTRWDTDLNSTNRKPLKQISPRGVLIFSWLFILLCWLPYLLTWFPANMTTDSASHVYQSLGLIERTNAHPIIYTLLVGWIIKMGSLFGSYQTGVILFSIIQMICLSGSFAITLSFMAKRACSRGCLIVCLLIYALYPVHADYSITIWKDIPFSASMLLYSLCLMQIVEQRGTFFAQKRNSIYFMLVCLALIFFRNNGILVLILTLPILIIFNKGERRITGMITAGIVLFYLIWSGPILLVLQIPQSPPREMLSIPLQQMARLTKTVPDFLTTDEKNRILTYFPYEDIGNRYDPRSADLIKNSFDESAYWHDPAEFFRTWLYFGKKYPKQYVEAFLCNNYGYWYPEASAWVVMHGIETIPSFDLPSLGIDEEPLIKGTLIHWLTDLTERRDIPLLSMNFSVGFSFWTILTLFIYNIYRRQKARLLVFAPVMTLWLTILFAPVFCEFRYVYSLFTCWPLLTMVTLGKMTEDSQY